MVSPWPPPCLQRLPLLVRALLVIRTIINVSEAAQLAASFIDPVYLFAFGASAIGHRHLLDIHY